MNSEFANFETSCIIRVVELLPTTFILKFRAKVLSDQKENKSEQVLQIIIGHVVAESYANSQIRQFVVSKLLYNK
jgi:hypothetical protein